MTRTALEKIANDPGTSERLRAEAKRKLSELEKIETKPAAKKPAQENEPVPMTDKSAVPVSRIRPATTPVESVNVDAIVQRLLRTAERDRAEDAARIVAASSDDVPDVEKAQAPLDTASPAAELLRTKGREIVGAFRRAQEAEWNAVTLSIQSGGNGTISHEYERTTLFNAREVGKWLKAGGLGLAKEEEFRFWVDLALRLLKEDANQRTEGERRFFVANMLHEGRAAAAQSKAKQPTFADGLEAWRL